MAIEGIVLSEAEGRLYVRGQPQQARASVDTAALEDLLNEGGYGDWQWDADGLDQAVADCNTRETPFVILVATRCDSVIEVEISEDGMQAKLNLSSPKGGKKACMEDIISALQEAGVSFGVDRETLLAACETGTAENVTAARGESAQEGSDSDFVELLAALSDRAPRSDANGLVLRRYGGRRARCHP